MEDVKVVVEWIALWSSLGLGEETHQNLNEMQQYKGVMQKGIQEREREGAGEDGERERGDRGTERENVLTYEYGLIV